MAKTTTTTRFADLSTAAREVLRDSGARQNLIAQEAWNDRRFGAAKREAALYLRDRLRRRVARKQAEHSQCAVSDIREQLDGLRRRAAVLVAEQLHAERLGRLYTSRHGRVLEGRGGCEQEIDIYSKSYSRRYGGLTIHHAGARLSGGEIVVENHRGREVARLPYTPGLAVALARAARRDLAEVHWVARRAIGAVSHAELTARFGEAGSDDRLQVRSPYAVADAGDRGLIVTDNPFRPRVVQVVVTDATTGLRHHLTVPPRFGKRLAAGESAADRVLAAIAWTFGLAAAQYAPAVEA